MTWENPSDMTWLTTYAELVYEIEATFIDRPNAMTHIDNCRFIIFDLTSTGISGEAAIALLYIMNKWYWYARDEWAFDGERIKIIREINRFTVRNYGDLAEFVNAIEWEGGCVPYNWASVCDDLNYDTSSWTVCS